MNNSSLPTIFYPFYSRPNWKMCWQLNDGQWVKEEFVTLPDVIRRKYYFIKCGGVNFRAMPRGSNFPFPFLLNLFYIPVSGENG